MTITSTHGGHDRAVPFGATVTAQRARRIEAVFGAAVEYLAALLIVCEILILLAGVIARYFLSARSPGPTKRHPSCSSGLPAWGRSLPSGGASTCA